MENLENKINTLYRDRLWLFGRSVNSWRVRAKALTLQQFTDRPNNARRLLGSLELKILELKAFVAFRH